MGEDEKKKKKHKNKDEDPEDEKKKKKDKKKEKEKDKDHKDKDKDKKKDKDKDKKKKKKKDKDHSEHSASDSSDDEKKDKKKDKKKEKDKEEKKDKDKKKDKKEKEPSVTATPSIVDNKGLKLPKPELFEAEEPFEPSEDAKKYGDVTNDFLKKKCKKIYKLLNFDPWNEYRRFDDDDLLDYVMDNPEPCRIKFEFDGFSGCIYPLSMCLALKASRDTVEAVYDAFPKAVKETDWWIGTPYHYASAYAAPAECVSFLLQKDPKGVEQVNYYHRTPLHMGALFKAPAASMALLCNKYPMACQIKDKDGYIPLHLACENGAPSEVVQKLVQTYPKSIYATAQYNMTPLHFAMQNARISVIEAILEATGGDNTLGKATDLLGHTPLHMALMSLSPYEIIEKLVTFCPEAVWMKTSKGELPLEIAERKRAPTEVQTILEKTMERILLEQQ